MKKNKDLSIWLYILLGIIKEKTQELKKPLRQLLMLTKKGIEFLIAQTETEEKEKPIKLKKIKIK